MNIDFSDLGESSAVCELRGACTCWLDSDLRADDGRTVSIEKLCLSPLVSKT